MPLPIDRRQLLVIGTLGTAALALPGFAQTSPLLALRGFTHGVASGEPAADGMLLWTRYVPATGGEARLRAEISETPDFHRVAGGGDIVTGGWRDHTAKVTVAGLKPGTRYFYRFVAPDGAFSPVGRTRTLPGDGARRFRTAIFSCSNLGFGWFNAYGHAAAQDDIDLAIHVGDYIYEYGPGVYPEPADEVAGRGFEPAREMIALADYRLRYASYRADPDLQALHAAMPWIVSQDDHETTNDAWEGGAQNHQPTEGDWSTRKAAAMQAWREWMPVGDAPYAAYDAGKLVTLFRTDTRQLARSPQPDLAAVMARPDRDAALAAFATGEWRDEARTMLGGAQERWLAAAMKQSVAAGRRWQALCSGTIVGRRLTDPAAPSWLGANASERVRASVARGLAAAKFGMPGGMDDWGGYPAARERLLRAALAANAELVVLSGDSHNAWAFDLQQDGRPAGVEFAGCAVNSAGLEGAFAAPPAVVAAGAVRASPELRWCDTSRRGYMVTTFTPDAASTEYRFVDTVRARRATASTGQVMQVRRGARRLAMGGAAAPR